MVRIPVLSKGASRVISSTPATHRAASPDLLARSRFSAPPRTPTSATTSFPRARPCAELHEPASPSPSPNSLPRLPKCPPNNPPRARNSKARLSPRPHPQQDPEADGHSRAELQNQYTNYKNTLQQLAQKIGDVEQEAEEHKYAVHRHFLQQPRPAAKQPPRRLVLDTLGPVPKDRKCFRLINGVLVERTVEDVIPALQTNATGLKTVLDGLVKEYKKKQEELDSWKVRSVMGVMEGCGMLIGVIGKAQYSGCKPIINKPPPFTSRCALCW